MTPEPPGAEIYQSARLAAAYAFSPPAVHAHVVNLIARRLGLTAGRRCRRALDVGCGAGLSAAALQPISDAVVGGEPAEAMLAHRHADVLNWCRETLAPSFERRSLGVVFDGYAAFVTPDPEKEYL